MTKDEALDLALKALEACIYPQQKQLQAITAIKQARALDKMAENARELGLDYEPVAPVREDWGPGPHECHSLTASVQEPVAWRYRGIFHEFDPSDWAEGPVTPLYTTPPAAQRQWVSLTDDEVEKACVPLGAAMLSFTEVARAIEAKLKEKNT